MMRYTLAIVLIFLSFCAFSQKRDSVFLKDGDKIIVDILEIEERKIKYKKLSNPDGPTYTLTSVDISYIILANGDIVRNKSGKLVAYSENVEIKEVNNATTNYNDPFYNKEKDAQKKNKIRTSTLYNFRKNMVGFNYAALITLDLEFTYERIFDKVGYFGIKVPIKFNMGVKPNYLKKHNIFTSGIQCNIYPIGQGRFSYFTGPVFHIRVMSDNDQVTVSGNNSITITIEPTRSTYLGFYMNNGCLFRASPLLYFGLSMGFGLRKDLARPNENSIFDLIGEASISFRF